VVARLLGGDADDRQLQMLADGLSDFPEGHALLAGCVQSCASRGGFQGQPEQARRIEPMHGGPAVRSVADEGRHALRTSNADQGRDEAVLVALAVHGRCETHNR
jgi:hypothetical protein